jgi:hypothetical protein
VAAREHGDEDPERAVRHSSESPSVSMALAPQAVAVTTPVRVILNTGARPVIEGVAQARIAPVAHADAELLAALPRHRGDAPVRPQSPVISLGQRLRGLGEHGGGDDSPHSRQGSEDSHVTGLSWNCLWAEVLQQRLDSARHGRALLLQQAQARQQQGDMGMSRLYRPRRHVDCRGLQGLTNGLHRKAPDPIHLEHGRHGLHRHSVRVGRGRDPLNERPEPRLIGRRT